MATPIQRSRRTRPSEKALYHHVGTGKSRVRRRFFGLAPADEKALEKELDAALTVNLQREGIRS